MEFEVRHSGGIDNCFVSLPFQLIQTLESTRPSHSILPQLLSLELRSLSSTRHWFVSWSGATSASSSIEIAPQFGDCILLPDNERVQVRVVANVDKATLVTIEPESEDDWEVLELNAEQAEAAILKQVRIVQEEMRFPLWLHGRTIITFMVVSTFPKKAVVQLAPGTEVAVAPKRRKKVVKKQDDFVQSSLVSKVPKALVRIQDQDVNFFHKRDIIGVELGVALTTVAYIHPETAKQFSFNSGQLVTIVPRLTAKEKIVSPETEVSGMKSASVNKDLSNGMKKDKNDFRQAIVYLLLSDSVARGHLSIPWSLRMHLRAVLHSWVYIKGCCGTDWKEDIPIFTFSPCAFKTHGQDTAFEKNAVEEFDNHKIQKRSTSRAYIDTIDWSKHYEFADAFSHVSSESGSESDYQPDDRKGFMLLQAWLRAQLDAISSASGVKVNSLILGKETLLHFEVKGLNIGSGRKVEKQASADSNEPLKNNNKNTEGSIQFFYLLGTPGLALPDKKDHGYKLTLGESGNVDIGDAELFEKITLGSPVSLLSRKERISSKSFRLNASSLSWMGSTTSDVIHRMTVLLSPASQLWLNAHNFPLPGHVLIYGPHGSGKTVLARAVAKSLEEHENILAHIIFVGCSGLALENPSSIRQRLSASISEALDHAPSLVILDDLDSLLSSSDSEGSQPSTSVTALTKFLTDIIDEYGEKRKSSCGIGPIAFIATVHTLESIPQSLSSSGRFDFHVQLPAPAATERGAILRHEIQRRSLHCSDDILQDVASKCDGYDAYDLEILVDRAVHAAIGRFLPLNSHFPNSDPPTLTRDDFSRAMHDFLPVAMRDITKSAPEDGRTGWDDVGGLDDIRNTIKEMIELPSKFPNIFSKAPMRLRSNILLYGPPGCGKTHIVGAAAAACSLRFISVKGPELLNKYIGASEQAVRDVFSKAAGAAPCLLFFDEFDSIAPKRGHDNTGVTDRVVNQFLTELDGVEVLTGVFVFAATSRPDLLDAALLRPGRLDRLLFCDFPSPKERLNILTVLSRKLPMAEDVDLEAIALMTEGFSGADLQALLSDAQLEAVHEHLNLAESASPGKLPVITDKILKSIASKARPSISDAEKQRLYDIYSQFLDSKKSASSQSRDAKGKRATLA